MGTLDAAAIQKHSQAKRTQTPGGTTAGATRSVTKVRPAKSASAAPTVAASAGRESSRPGIASRSAAPTISSPASACNPERPQATAGPSAEKLLRHPQKAGMAMRSASPRGSSASARRAGEASGRTGLRSLSTAARSPGGIIGRSAISGPSPFNFGIGAQSRAEPPHRPARTELGGSHADAEALGDLLEAEPVDVMEHPGLPAAGGQARQGVREVPGLDGGRRRSHRRLGRFSAALMARPPPSRAPVPPEDVAGDAEHPGAHGERRQVGVAGAVDLQEGVLH